MASQATRTGATTGQSAERRIGRPLLAAQSLSVVAARRAGDIGHVRQIHREVHEPEGRHRDDMESNSGTSRANCSRACGVMAPNLDDAGSHLPMEMYGNNDRLKSDLVAGEQPSGQSTITHGQRKRLTLAQRPPGRGHWAGAERGLRSGGYAL